MPCRGFLPLVMYNIDTDQSMNMSEAAALNAYTGSQSHVAFSCACFSEEFSGAEFGEPGKGDG